MDKPGYKSNRRHTRQYGLTDRSSPKASGLVATIIYLSLLLCVLISVLLFTNGPFTIGGVPTPIIMSFLQDETARDAFFQGDNKKLHARLQAMGIEEKVKAFYRPQIHDEAKLDQHIHQILYDRTGYVGIDYQVNSEGILVLKQRLLGSRE